MPAGTKIRYMGNKVALAKDVATLISDIEASRPLVDLFGGMCSVAGAVSNSARQVWINDAQHYASLAAHCLLRSQDLPPSRDRVVSVLSPAYRKNLNTLGRRFKQDLATERRILSRDSFSAYQQAQVEWKHVGNDEVLAAEAAKLRTQGQAGPHRLATLTFSWGYFGLRQSIEIDSVRAAIDASIGLGLLTSDEAAWCRLALLQTCSRVASTPGHFAQFLTGANAQSFARIRSARRRSVWDGVLDDLEILEPFGTKRWRKRNRVLTGDALSIWPILDCANLPPAVFYADPPYSKEQYSRFYHVLETLELYDYPEATGTGRYRSGRFTTPLAQKSGVLRAVQRLCCEIAARDGVLLLSYPSSGLLTRSLDVDIQALLGEYFQDVSLPISMLSKHSTLGARHGEARCDVTEYVWLAK